MAVLEVELLAWRGRKAKVLRRFAADSIGIPREGGASVEQLLCFVFLILAAPSSVLAQEPQRADGQKQIINSLGMKLTLVPSGEFMMGNSESAENTAMFFNKAFRADFLSAEEFKDECPQHRVRVTRPFYLGTHHVTRGQFRRFVEDCGYKTQVEKLPGVWRLNRETKELEFRTDYSWRNVGFQQTDEHPVVAISWNDATAFCEWLGRKEKREYRLPTEAEWEFACRAGTNTRYWCGDDPEVVAKVGNIADAAFDANSPIRNSRWRVKSSDGYVFTAPVGKFKPSAFGLYDMHGNAWQWCSDWYGKDYYGKSPRDDPKGPTTGVDRVLRGSSFIAVAFHCRSSSRMRNAPVVQANHIGFRVARTQ